MKISVITVNLNNAAGLEQTIGSVIAQSFQPLEFIVVDGASTDGSREVMHKFDAHISIAISEKDKGVYNAMNKGIKKATGEYLIFLNSGDTFLDSKSLQTLIDNGDNADIIYGDIQMTVEEKSRTVHFPAHVGFKFFYINSLPHACTLISKQLFNKVGLYREDFKIVSDWAFFILAICRYNCSQKHVDATIANFMLGGLSSTGMNIIETERKAFLTENFPAFLWDYKEMAEIEDELLKAKMQLGYRVHRKIRKLFFDVR